MRIALLLFALLPLVGCTGSRPPTSEPPPSLEHVGDTQVKSAMWRLARQTGALRDILETSQPPTPEAHEAASRLLTDMLGTVEHLEKDPLTSPHPVLNAGLPAFRADIEAALQAVRSQPPQYEPAKRLASSCKRCHVVAARPLSPRSWHLAAR